MLPSFVIAIDVGAVFTEIAVIWDIVVLLSTKTRFRLCCATYNLPSVTANALGAVTAVFVDTTVFEVVLITDIELLFLLATKTRSPLTAIALGAKPTLIVFTARVDVLMRVTLLLPALATHTLSPVTASAVGVVPTVTVAVTVFERVSIR